MFRAVALVCLVAAPAGAVETMRIEMLSTSEPVQLSGKELGVGLDEEDAHFRSLPLGRAELRLSHGQLLLDGGAAVGDSVRFRAGSWALDAGVPGNEAIRAAGIEVRGDVVVRVHGGRLQLINVIPLEDYLAAVLGGEMPPSFPEEALKAQAVAARTYALQKKLEAYGDAFYLGSSVLNQVYGGVSREDERTRAAVRATRGEVLTYELAPIEAYFHASCGGRTESGLAALNRDLPYLQPVDCPCGKLAASHWELTLPWSEVRAATGAEDPRALRVISRTPTGRARRVALGDGRSMDAVSFRQRLGYQRLKSLAFEVEFLRPEQAIHFTGRGYGHGAGLCQRGAAALAEQGWDYRRILFHYYPGTELQTLY